MTVDRRKNAAVAWAKGQQHAVYEDRFRLLTSDVPLVSQQPERGQLAAVFDGVGSAPKGMQAAQRMADALLAWYQAPARYSPATGELRRLLDDANEEVRSWGFIEGTDRPAGACAGTVAWIRAKSPLVVFHAGDTQALLITDSGSQELTGRHTSADGALRNYFGAGSALSIEIRQWAWSDGDLLLIMSDGATKPLSPAEVSTIMREEADPARGAEQVLRRAAARGATDDITVLAVELLEE